MCFMYAESNMTSGWVHVINKNDLVLFKVLHPHKNLIVLAMC